MSTKYNSEDARQSIRCGCGEHLDLAYTNFEQEVSGVDIRIEGLPVLKCSKCSTEYLPDRSRATIAMMHKKSIEKSSPVATAKRKKLMEDFNFTKIAFLYDADDYYYIPGLERSFDKGFLQPVFFSRRVLFKYDNMPDCNVNFSSTTYGQITTEKDNSISFGINRHGKVIMWLGDIATLPDNEQHYLRSENVLSDHSIGSEFYDGQIEVEFTPPPLDKRLFGLRSKFVDACSQKFGTKIAHLDEVVLDLALSLNPPVLDTLKERRHVADALNKIYIESLDNAALAKIIATIGATSKGPGTIKRLQAILETISPGDDINALMSPFYILYDLRVAYSHLTSQTTAEETLKTVCSRLGIPTDASLQLIFEKMVDALSHSFEKFAAIVAKGF